MKRWGALLLALAGCDQLFNLRHVDEVQDGGDAGDGRDAVADDSRPAAICHGAPPAPMDYMTGANPNSVTLADLNKDGALDLIVPEYNAGAVAIFLNDATGHFTRQADVPVGTSPTRTVVLDIDGDMKLDLVTANYNSSSLSLSLGNGQGAFQATPPISLGNNPVALAALAIDGSPDDLVVALYGDDVIVPLVNNGSGSFAPSANLPTVDGPNDLLVANVNGDGAPDLIVTGGNTSVLAVHLANTNGTGSWLAPTAIPVGSTPSVAVVGRFDSDANLDVAVAATLGQQVDVLYGMGDGTFGTHQMLPSTAQVWGVAAGHLDGDSSLDLAVTHYTGAKDTFVYPGSSGMSFAFPKMLPSHGAGVGVAVGNLDGKQPDDVVVGNYDESTVTVYLGCLP
ncbi:MAG TPA: VCBS repeat-containing protein [Kofleriaceae bacterium]|nr:VCBS repeat-containing protein [Kofleriaceae bacterium]